MCALNIKQAEDNDVLKPGTALLAPGGMQLMIDKGRVHIIPGDARLTYKPSVDMAFASAAKHYPGKTLGIVLTGMGSDGKEGARLLKETGAYIWAQDEATSVIYGMPMAVAKANLTDAILPLQDIAPRLIKEVR
jgi:two-component system, chemotaxis family, protein-glutamate methylesterase/glutaminase